MLFARASKPMPALPCRVQLLNCVGGTAFMVARRTTVPGAVPTTTLGSWAKRCTTTSLNAYGPTGSSATARTTSLLVLQLLSPQPSVMRLANMWNTPWLSCRMEPPQLEEFTCRNPSNAQAIRSTLHNPAVSTTYNPIRSTPHNPAVSITYNPIRSTLHNPTLATHRQSNQPCTQARHC